MKVFLVFFYLFFSSLLQAEESTSEDVFNWSKRLPVHYTPWINEFVSNKSQFFVGPMNEQQKSIEPERTDFAFTCPGHSLLVGIASKFDKQPFDRIFRFSCAFYANEKDEPLEKTSCTKDGTKYVNTPGKNATFNCESAQIIHGLSSAMRPAIDLDDRWYQPLCCQLTSWSKKNHKLKQTGCTNLTATQEEQNFDLLCPQNQAISKIDTVYASKTQDRTFNITCCPIE